MCCGDCLLVAAANRNRRAIPDVLDLLIVPPSRPECAVEAI